MSLSLEVAMMALLWDKILSTVQCCNTSDMILCCVKMVEHIDVKILSPFGSYFIAIFSELVTATKVHVHPRNGCFE